MNAKGATAPSPLMAWVHATRPATLGAAAAPIFVGEALAFATHRAQFSLPLAAVTLCCAMLLQIGANLANDYFDYKKGADGPARLGPARATQQGWISPRTMLGATALVFALAAALGLLLAMVGGWPFWLLGGAAILAALGYTGGPRPYGYHGLGDVAVFVFFGPVAVCGAYYLQSQQLGWTCIAASFAMGFAATAILVVNNIRDRSTDEAAGKRTLAVRLGLDGSRLQYAALLVLALGIPPLVYLFGVGGAGWLLPLGATPLGLVCGWQLWRSDGRALNPLLGRTARFTLLLGLLIGIGAVL